MKRALLEWSSVAAVFALAAGARYLLIQVPAVGQACEIDPSATWCATRALVIRTFSTFGLGYASMAAILMTVFTWNRTVAWIAALIGAAGLVLYCYEPAAVSFVTGALVLARAQSGQPRVSLRRIGRI